MNELEHGSVATDNGVTVGQYAIYNCDVGYDLIGLTERVCQLNSTWSGSEPTCKVKGKNKNEMRWFTIVQKKNDAKFL